MTDRRQTEVHSNEKLLKIFKVVQKIIATQLVKIVVIEENGTPKMLTKIITLNSVKYFTIYIRRCEYNKKMQFAGFCSLEQLNQL